MKEAVFPFVKFPGADTLLGPEMKSTGEVMGIDSDFGRAYAKAQIQAGNSLPDARAACSCRCARRTAPAIGAARARARRLGFRVLATPGTARALAARGRARRGGAEGGAAPRTASATPCERIEAGDVDLVINTVGSDPAAVRDSASLRRSALLRGVPYFTTAAGVRAARRRDPRAAQRARSACARCRRSTGSERVPIDPRTPVLVGAGVASQREEDPDARARARAR